MAADGVYSDSEGILPPISRRFLRLFLRVKVLQVFRLSSCPPCGGHGRHRGCSLSEMGLVIGRRSWSPPVRLKRRSWLHPQRAPSLRPFPLSGIFSWHSCLAFDRYLPDSLSVCRGLNAEEAAVNPIIGEKRRIGEFEAFLCGFSHNDPRYIRFPESNR